MQSHTDREDFIWGKLVATNHIIMKELQNQTAANKIWFTVTFVQL
jgi:hypothetical protein